MFGITRLAHLSFARPVSLCLVACAPLISVADNPVNEVALDTLEPGTLGVAFGARFGNSPYQDVDDLTSVYSDQSWDFLPSYIYQGERLFASGATVGWHFLNTESLTLDALVSYRFNRLEPEASSYFDGLEEREQSVDAGLAGSWQGDWGALELSWLTDTQGRHKGDEIDLTYRYKWRQGDWFLSPFVSVISQDANLTNYYYGVSDAEARADLPAYAPGSSTVLRAGLQSTYQWTPHVLLYGNIAADFYDDAAKDSPLVDASGEYRVMLGASYLFGNVQKDLARRRNEGPADFSWRVNYGYTAQQTFHKVHRGQLEKARDADTNLVGLTLGKLLLDGEKLEFWGRSSLNRRLEGDFGDDFWELNLYGMLMGTGYSPWTSKELFRYGFGFGVSYSEEISAQEQIKQDKREEKTSHYLTYLEAQLDTPLSTLFGERAWNNCYVGITLVHRSGIFGSSDIFNNVSGGSDVVSGHLECKH